MYDLRKRAFLVNAIEPGGVYAMGRLPPPAAGSVAQRIHARARTPPVLYITTGHR
jgi:hypothetical protein